ncbi:CaiB/BaiF CoA-transferase family protein [Sphingomicrobium sp. XHP0239]|uniref:CaiB/BaiF CoA transferase family protein n=1 Tax=Sphingomicrobium maritimum TaxID=3133972 RepID=UPI0031CCA984
MDESRVITSTMAGPLQDLTIIELAGIGPAPFAAMMFADHGARIIRIERADRLKLPEDPVERGRIDLPLDLRREDARAALFALVKDADALIDPYRPGRIEALGIGPAELQAINPRLAIGRLTGYGQTGPLSQQAGHDINYLAMSGLLRGMGARNHPPVPPANLIADYAGGAMMLCFGMLASLLEVRGGASKGRVIDASITEGTALVGSMLFGLSQIGEWSGEPESNHLDGGAPFYRTYRCSDGQYIAVGALEPQFRRQFLKTLGLESDPLFANDDKSRWSEQAEVIEERIGAEPSSQWEKAFAGKDACVTLVPAIDEIDRHPQHRERGAFALLGKGRAPAPVPRYGERPEPFARSAGKDGAREVLRAAGLDDDQISAALGSSSPSD